MAVNYKAYIESIKDRIDNDFNEGKITQENRNKAIAYIRELKGHSITNGAISHKARTMYYLCLHMGKTDFKDSTLENSLDFMEKIENRHFSKGYLGCGMKKE